jgi:hypothetical protein
MKVSPFQALVLGTLLTLSGLTSGRSEDKSTWIKPLNNLPKSVQSRVLPMGGDDLAYYVVLDGKRSKNVGQAETVAAWIYAIESGDTEVSMRELVANGYWPYRDTRSKQSLDALIPGAVSDYSIGKHVLLEYGNPKWFAESRNLILSAFIGEWAWRYKSKLKDHPKLLSETMSQLTKVPTFWKIESKGVKITKTDYFFNSPIYIRDDLEGALHFQAPFFITSK